MYVTGRVYVGMEFRVYMICVRCVCCVMRVCRYGVPGVYDMC